MPRKKIDLLNGRGKVWSGEEQVATVDYEITEWQEFTSIQPRGGSPKQELPGLVDRRGFIAEEGNNLFDFLGANTLTLELKDGRFVDFVVSGHLNNAMTKWGIACSGSIRPER